jgi:AbrB family looped-hinge helix DNA binding protein
VKTAKLSSKSQITIPAWARAALGLQPGQDIAISVEDGRIVLERIDTSIDSLQGALKGVYGDPDEYVRKLRGEWDRDVWNLKSTATRGSRSTRRP